VTTESRVFNIVPADIRPRRNTSTESSAMIEENRPCLIEDQGFRMKFNNTGLTRDVFLFTSTALMGDPFSFDPFSG